MKKLITITLTFLVFTLTACATFSDPKMQETYDACVNSKLTVKAIKTTSSTDVANFSDDKKAFCKSYIEWYGKQIKNRTEAQKKQMWNALINRFKNGN